MPMKIMLLFTDAEAGAAGLLDPYCSPGFIQALLDEHLEPVLVRFLHDDLQAPTTSPSSAGGPAGPVSRCDARSFGTLLQTHRPAIVQTFGDIARLAPIWRAAAEAGCRVVHFVPSGAGDQMPGGKIRRTAWLRGGLNGRRSSRHVSAVLGSNRASIAEHVEAGFFPQARFAMTTLPPLAVPAGRETWSPPPDSATAVLGCCQHDGADEDIKFVLDAMTLTGTRHLFRVVIFQRSVSAAANSLHDRNVAFLTADSVDDFIQAIDLLVVPRSDDRAMEAVLLALRSNKIVIAPDGGTVAEALQFGRHGVLFNAGSAFDLAMAIDKTTGAWSKPPFDFAGTESVIGSARPQEVARVFSQAYRKLQGEAAPRLETVAAQ
jgi:hypothetical protein